jgi:hypothetical protein
MTEFAMWQAKFYYSPIIDKIGNLRQTHEL